MERIYDLDDRFIGQFVLVIKESNGTAISCKVAVDKYNGTFYLLSHSSELDGHIPYANFSQGFGYPFSWAVNLGKPKDLNNACIKELYLIIPQLTFDQVNTIDNLIENLI